MSVLRVTKHKYKTDDPGRLKTQLEQLGYSCFTWKDSPGTRYSAHSHPHDEVIVVHEGSISFLIDGQEFLLQPGDELLLPANTRHSALSDGKTGAGYFVCST